MAQGDGEERQVEAQDAAQQRQERDAEDQGGMTMGQRQRTRIAARKRTGWRASASAVSRPRAVETSATGTTTRRLARKEGPRERSAAICANQSVVRPASGKVTNLLSLRAKSGSRNSGR
jgi:hypothetical protein